MSTIPSRIPTVRSVDDVSRILDPKGADRRAVAKLAADANAADTSVESLIAATITHIESCNIPGLAAVEVEYRIRREAGKDRTLWFVAISAKCGEESLYECKTAENLNATADFAISRMRRTIAVTRTMAEVNAAEAATDEAEPGTGPGDPCPDCGIANEWHRPTAPDDRGCEAAREAVRNDARLEYRGEGG